jgi:hypothetical protein
MNVKYLAFIIGLLTAGAVSTRAQTAVTPAPAPAPAAPAAAAAPAAPTPPSWSFTLTPTYVSTYMFRGQYLGGQSFEPSITASYGNLNLEIWANDPWNNQNKVPGQSDPEIDPQGSYTFTINDSLTIQPGFTWYTYCRAPTNQGFYRMTFEPNLAVNYTVDGVTLTPKFYYDVILHTATYEFDAAYTVPLKSIGSEFDFSGTVGTYYGTDVINTDDVPNAKDTAAWGNYWLLGVSMPFTITSSVKLIVGWAYSQGTDAYTKTGSMPKAVNTSAVGRGTASVGIAWTF